MSALQQMLLGEYGNADPLIANVVFLANFGAAFVDEVRGKTITVTGNPTINSTIPFAGGKSVKFDGTTASSLTMADSSDWTFPADFCVEGYFYQETNTGVTGIVDFGGINGGPNGNWQSQNLYLDLADSSSHWVATSSSTLGTAVVPDVGSAGMTPNTWTHYAMTRQSNSYRLFLNGALVRTISSSTAPYDPSYGVLYGAYPANNWNSSLYALLKGALGPQRITKGVARYTSAFTPEFKPFPTR